MSEGVTSRRTIRPLPVRLDLYRSQPNPRHEMRYPDFPCLTVVLRNNADTRDYLVVDATIGLQDVRDSALAGLGPLELWQASVAAERALFFLDLLGDDQRRALRDLRILGYCVARNKMEREWDEFEDFEPMIRRWLAEESAREDWDAEPS